MSPCCCLNVPVSLFISSSHEHKIMIPGLYDTMHYDRGDWTRPCDDLRDHEVVWILYGDACTKVLWSSLATFCYQYTRNAYCWNPLVMRFQKSGQPRSTPGLLACYGHLNYLAVGKARLHTGFCQQTAIRCTSRSIPTILQQSTGYCSFITNYAYLRLESELDAYLASISTFSELIAC